MAIESFEQCQLKSEKRWQEIELELQKIKDEQSTILTRLSKQEDMVSDIQTLSTSVASLATSMDGLLKEQQAQNTRLIDLEKKPMKRFDNIIDTIIKLVITAAISVLLVKIGLQ